MRLVLGHPRWLPPDPRCAFRLAVHCSNPRRGSARRLLTASSTAISTSPPQFQSAKQHLYNSLTELSQLNYANQSRVQLALRCLEQANTPTRVAILGTPVDSSSHYLPSTPARLLKALLADPLLPAQSWEEELVNWSGRQEAHGLLLRYSPIAIPPSPDPNAPLAVLSIPSKLLQDYNLEILLSSLPAVQLSMEDVHVPTLVTPVPASNYNLTNAPHRSTGMVMRYPVHKSIIFATGLDELFSTAGLMSHLSASPDNVLSAAWLPDLEIGVQHDVAFDRRNVRYKIQLLDLAVAEYAVEQVRSLPPYSQKPYRTSPLESLIKWITAGTKPQPDSVRPATKSLISSILHSVSLPPPIESDAPVASTEDVTCTADNLKTLTNAMHSFSTNSHKDLKASLNAAFSSPLWTRKLAWYRLPFYLDDVGYLAFTALQGNFLAETEREGWILSGRMWGAGFRNFIETNTPTPIIIKPTPSGATLKPSAPAEQELSQVLTAADSTSPSTSTPPYLPSHNKPCFPPFFPTAKTHIISSLIPPLKSSATNHVLSSTTLLFTSFLTTTLLYFSEISFYTSFSATAAGGILSLAYLQRKWEGKKRRFENDVREIARGAVVEAERWGWGVLKRGIEERAKVCGVIVGEENGRESVPGELIAPSKANMEKTERARRAVQVGLRALKELDESEKSPEKGGK